MDRIKVERAIAGLTEWQKHVQTNSDIDSDISTAIEALKAQLFSEGATKGATSDLISRMETVEHLRRVLEATVPITDYDEGYIDGIEFAISTVSTMPIIQPQSTAGQLNDGAQSTVQSTDLVDRQAAIDAAESAYVRNMFPTPLIREVPPVEPEPTCEQVAEYCKRRCLHVVTDDFFRAAQPEPKEGHWIPHESPDGGEQYECSECGVLWEFNDGSPEDNEAFYCPKCGARMKGN